jgi:dTMP kinase
MATRRGAFIVIEGTDGSGKGTQFQLLRDRLIQAGYQVEAFDFPQYDKPSSYFVNQYLNGQYGSADMVGPYTASLFYALDRYEAAPRIQKALEEGKVVIANRFTGSNMGHQGTKFRNPEERRGYFIWLDNLEFEMLQIPRPDVSFVLRVPVDIAVGLIDNKGARTYTDKKRDVHEADRSHLERALAVYDDLTQLFPKDFQRIDCVRSGKLLDIEAIQTMLWEKIVPMLPQPSQLEMPMAAAAPAGESTAATEATKPDVEAPQPAPDNRPAVTSDGKDIYAFTAKLEPAVVAAVLASLSRAGGELRTSVLDEFAKAVTKDEVVLERTIKAYGEDSAQQFIHQHVVIAKASGLLADTLMDCRMANFATPDIRYIQYDAKDSNGMYKYHLPADLDGDTAIMYRKHMDKIFDTYAAMLPRLNAHLQETSGVPIQSRRNEWVAAMLGEARTLLQGVLPVAATATVAAYASAKEYDTLLTKLAASRLPEANVTCEKVLGELNKTIPAYMKTAGDPDSGGSEAAYRNRTYTMVRQHALDFLPGNHADETEAVRLVGVTMRNELDVIADMLYEHSSLPLHIIQTEVSKWPYSRKLGVFDAYIGDRLHKRERPGRALERIHYTWDITCDYAVYRELQRHRIIDAPAVQLLTPRYGYEVPEIIEAAGLSDEYEACFDTSLALYSKLQEAGFAEAAQYATLRGHKLRCTLTYNAREAFIIHEQCTAPHMGAGIRTLATGLHDKLSEIHPLIAEAMRFVSQGEDPELTELGRIRFDHFKNSRKPRR